MTAKDRDDSLLTIADVMRIARVTERTVRRWKDRGHLPYVQLPGNDLRFRRETLDALLCEVTQAAPAPPAEVRPRAARKRRTAEILAGVRQPS